MQYDFFLPPFLCFLARDSLTRIQRASACPATWDANASWGGTMVRGYLACACNYLRCKYTWNSIHSCPHTLNHASVCELEKEVGREGNACTFHRGATVSTRVVLSLWEIHYSSKVFICYLLHECTFDKRENSIFAFT